MPTRFHGFIVLRGSLKLRGGVLLAQNHTAMVEIWIPRLPATVTTMKCSKPFLGTTSSHCGALRWASKNWCFWTVVLEKTLESPLDCKEGKPVHPKGNQSWIFFGRTDAEAESPILWPPDAKNWLIGNDPDAGKDWRQEEKGTTEDEMVGWHHQLNGHEFEQAPRVGDGQGSLACYSPWGHKESDMTERLDWEPRKEVRVESRNETLCAQESLAGWVFR